MDRREVQKRRLASEAKWNIPHVPLCISMGGLGCHDIEVVPTSEPELQPGEEFYEISLEIETGKITVTGYDGEGNKLGSRQL